MPKLLLDNLLVFDALKGRIEVVHGARALASEIFEVLRRDQGDLAEEHAGRRMAEKYNGIARHL
jgi:hypothetical protein